MATIRRRGDRWQVQVRRLGFVPQTKSFLSRRDAEVWARQTELTVDRGDLPADRTVLATTKLGDLVRRYRDEITPTKKGCVTETVVLTRFLRHSICQRTLVQLQPTDFAAYRDERLGEVSAATVKRQLNTIRNLFTVARDEWNLPLGANPLDKIKLVGVDNRRERRLRPGELEMLEEAATQTRNPLILAIVLFALETGLRRGEILNVRGHHADLERRSLVVPESKNGHSRVIPLSTKAAGLLKCQNREGDQYAFPITANALRLSWERLRDRAKLNDLHFHDLRHEAISRFFERGLTVPEVAAISGHREMRMLMRYAHVRAERILELLG